MSHKIAIVLCSKNGEKYIQRQLDSLKSQTINNFDLYINDDGSNDKTLNIVKNNLFPEGINIFLTTRKYSSFQKNFINTLKSISNKYDYYFFCDQDDIWTNDKIKKSIDFLKERQSKPSLICSRTKIIDENGNVIGLSPKFTKKPSIRNALVQSIAGGNTMGFNKETKLLLNDIKDVDNVVSHDWTTYLLVSLFNGDIHYSVEPFVFYRNHSDNLIGSNNGLLAKLTRVKKLLKGEFKNWNNMNMKLISEFELPKESMKIVEDFSKMRDSNFVIRPIRFMKLGIYRQNLMSNIALLISVLLNKL